MRTPIPTNLSDQGLVMLCKTGNDRAFGVLVERHSQALYKSLLSMLKDSMLAEDFMQDTFIKVLEAIQNGTYADQKTLRSWILRIGHNLAIDYLRKVERQPTMHRFDQSEIFDEMYSSRIYKAIDPEARMIRLEVYADMYTFLNKLPPEQKQVVILRVFCELPYAEIAEITGESINTCLGRKRYALINLRKFLNIPPPVKRKKVSVTT